MYNRKASPFSIINRAAMLNRQPCSDSFIVDFSENRPQSHASSLAYLTTKPHTVTYVQLFLVTDILLLFISHSIFFFFSRPNGIVW